MKQINAKTKNIIIKALAIIVRYVIPVAIVAMAVIIPWRRYNRMPIMLFIAGGGFLVYALYLFIGYKLHFRHICCLYQNANGQKMTPESAKNEEIRKVDGKGIPSIFALIGLVCAIAGAAIILIKYIF